MKYFSLALASVGAMLLPAVAWMAPNATVVSTTESLVESFIDTLMAVISGNIVVISTVAITLLGIAIAYKLVKKFSK